MAIKQPKVGQSKSAIVAQLPRACLVLHRYIAECEFRYNGGEPEDGERTVKAIRGAEGNRLFYREPAAQHDKRKAF